MSPTRTSNGPKNGLRGITLILPKPLIAVLPGGGASWGKAAKHKRWAASNYAHLIDKIIENFDAAIILLGDSKEEELCREVVNTGPFSFTFCCWRNLLVRVGCFVEAMPGGYCQ